MVNIVLLLRVITSFLYFNLESAFEKGKYKIDTVNWLNVLLLIQMQPNNCNMSHNFDKICNSLIK